MRKITFYLSFLLIALCNSLSFSQDLSINEGSDKTICEKIVIVDAIWIFEGTIKADISILEKQNSKPITGGYKKGDEITISSEPGCTYYIYSITKYGHSKDKGTVTLSKTAPEAITEVFELQFSKTEGSSFRVGNNDWFISSISGDGDKAIANITVTQNTALIENITLSAGDIVWFWNRAYKVDSIKAPSKDKVKDPAGNYEFNPGEIRFKAVTEYLPEK